MGRFILLLLPPLLLAGGPAEEPEGEAKVAEDVAEERAAAVWAIAIGGLILRPIHSRFRTPPATIGLDFHAMQCVANDAMRMS